MRYALVAALLVAAVGCCSDPAEEVQRPPQGEIDAEKAEVATIGSIACTPGPRSPAQVAAILSASATAQGNIDRWFK